jgi:hypothetical protein
LIRLHAKDAAGVGLVFKKSRGVFYGGYVTVLVTIVFVQWPPKEASTKPSQETENFTFDATA